MPRIVLKPNSPDYADLHRPRPHAHPRACDMPGCDHAGLHRAPKNRALNEYYWFCTAHVQDYNAAWDFFDGMAQRDIEYHLIQSIYGDRPTRRYDQNQRFYAELERKIHQMRFGSDEDNAETGPRHHTPTGDPETDALAILGLEAPVTFAVIKSRYRDLVKQYHPDTPQGRQKNASDLIKQINMAYTILKLAYRRES